MYRHIITGLGVEFLESSIKSLYVIVHTGPGDTLNWNYADGVLIAELDGFLRIEGSVLECEGHTTHLDLPELGKFLPYDLIA